MSSHKQIQLEASRVIESAAARGITLGTAESCTGGLICAALTSVPGSSAVVYGGVCSYAAAIKEDVLGVNPHLIEVYGIVSEETAQAMAVGVCQVLGCDLGVSTTGIAGPSGAEPGKPVGTVCIGVAHADGMVRSLTIYADGNRPQVRAQAVLAALQELLSEISE